MSSTGWLRIRSGVWVLVRLGSIAQSPLLFDDGAPLTSTLLSAPSKILPASREPYLAMVAASFDST